MKLQTEGLFNKYRLVLLAIFLSSFLLKLYFATSYPLIAGMDAGYYVVEFQEVLDYGYPQTSDPPIAFFIGAFFSWLVGDIFLGFKIAISLFSAAIAFPIYKIVKYITRDRSIGLFAAFLGAFSVSNMFIMGDLFKNTIGLFFGAWFIYFLIKAIKETNFRNAGLAIIAFILMVGSHFSTSAYLIFSVSPFLLLLPIYDYFKEKKITKEAKVCLTILGGMALTGIIILLIKPGLLGDYSLGPLNIDYFDEDVGGIPQKPSGINLEIFTTYSIFSLLAFQGIYSAYKLDPKWVLLFVPWLIVSFLLTQPLLVENSWVFRFEMDSYILISILAGLGIFYFKKEKGAFYGVMFLMSIYTIYMFVEAGDARMPLISLEEYNGLLSFAQLHSEAEILGPRGGLAYWVHAAGLPTGDLKVSGSRAPNQYAMFSVQSNTKSSFGGAQQTQSISQAQLTQLPKETVAAKFGNYVIFPASELSNLQKEASPHQLPSKPPQGQLPPKQVPKP